MSWENVETPIRRMAAPFRLMDAAGCSERAENPAPATENLSIPNTELFPGLSLSPGELTSDILSIHQMDDFAARCAAAAAASGEVLLKRSQEDEATRSTALSLTSTSEAGAGDKQTPHNGVTYTAHCLRMSKLLLCRDPCIEGWLAASSEEIACASSHQPVGVEISCSDTEWEALQRAWLDGFAGSGPISLEHALAVRGALGIAAEPQTPDAESTQLTSPLPLAEYMFSLAPQSLWAALQEGLEGPARSSQEGAAASEGGGSSLPSLPPVSARCLRAWVHTSGASSVPSVAATGGAAVLSLGPLGRELQVHNGLVATAGSTLQRLASLPQGGEGQAVRASAAAAGSGVAPLLHVEEGDGATPPTVAAALLLLYCPWVDFVLNHNVDVMQLIVFLDKWGMDAQRAMVLQALPDSFTPEQASALVAASSSGLTGQLPDAVRHAAMKALVQQAERLQESATWQALSPRVQAEVSLLAYAHSHNPMGPVETFTRATELLGVIKETIQALQEMRELTVDNITRTESTQRDLAGRQSSRQVQQWREYLQRQQQALRQHDGDIDRLRRFYDEQRQALQDAQAVGGGSAGHEASAVSSSSPCE